MKKYLFIAGMALAFIAEIALIIVFSLRTPVLPLDTVAVNEVSYAVAYDFENMDEHEKITALEYTVLDREGSLLYTSKAGLSESVNAAIAHRDTILDIEKNDEIVGKLIINNDGTQALGEQKNAAVIILCVALVLQAAACIGYAFYMHSTVIKPFRKLKGFAERVAGGNLDIPLEMDRQNLFGAFTESFDIMRSELKKARMAEAQAQQSKKELVAKLSHDIKTPVASIKAISEVGLALSSTKKDRESYSQIIGKADQINTLVTNLFTATLEELEQLTVSPAFIDSKSVKAMLENADYLRRADICDLPDCLVFADPLRLQQVFDNIFSNSYKYAKTEIFVTYEKCEKYLEIIIEDCGGGVDGEELLFIKEKFRRGSNSKNTEGAGLGLYISDYFMKEAGGKLAVENGERGLKVEVFLSLNAKV